jgi:hypothetical protein
MKSDFQFHELDYHYVIGIDLGTTNSAVAYVDLKKEGNARHQINFFEVPQVTGINEFGNRPILPSFLYLPGKYDLPEGSYTLPWDQNRNYIVGEFAREQGAKVPSRLVASAKSWLSHAGVDRHAPILPWGAADEIPKVSPVTASMRYLQHIREAWDYRIAKGNEERQFDQQLIILTVPASFDEVARELTVAAAKEAGIHRVILLEEPLAAFYAWLSRNEASWQKDMSDGQLILVCDIGGGTTDFSIIGIKAGEKGLRFNRLAVGDHLMLGGDNMDIHIAKYLEKKITGKTRGLDSRRWHQLIYQCRRAKEMLLSQSDENAEMAVTVTGQAGSLIAGTIKGSLNQTEIQNLIFEDFFPEVTRDAHPTSLDTTPGEFGLPYVSDPAVTRHLASFWQQYESLLRQETNRQEVFPDYILFNGGALTPQSLRWHLTLLLGKWFAPAAGTNWLPKELSNPRPELAVAIGAAYYGKVRLGEGVRVGSGSPRSYYVAVNSPDNERLSLCLVPRGTEEGFEIHLDQHNFEALTNQPVAFQLFSSSTRVGDKLGEIVDLSQEEVTTLPPIQTVLRFGKQNEARQIPVNLGVKLTEVGTLDLFCESKSTNHRWKLQFNVRQDADHREQIDISETVDEQLAETALQILRDTFSSESPQSNPEKLIKSLEETLSMPKEKWPTSFIRTAADTLLESRDARKKGAEFESRWLNLLGFCLRPGFGDPLDEWRMKQIWKLQFEGIFHNNNQQVRSEWWIFWRRVAGGLTAGKQTQIYQQVYPALGIAASRKSGRGKNLKLSPHESNEVWMMLGNFELLKPAEKIELGNYLIKKLNIKNPREIWTISRLGARQPFYGPLDRVVPPDAVVPWIEILLDSFSENPKLIAHALVQLGKKTNDRSRDIPESLFTKVEATLQTLPDSQHWLNRLTLSAGADAKDEQDWVFGESLPSGLILTTAP